MNACGYLIDEISYLKYPLSTFYTLANIIIRRVLAYQRMIQREPIYGIVQWRASLY